MNNSVFSPHFPQPSTRAVGNRGVPSTGCEFSNPSPTWGFTRSSTIHTPYYYYLVQFNYRDSRRKGTTCAYPS